MNKKQTIVMLRWVLIIAFSYLPLVDNTAGLSQARLALLIAAALASNLIIARVPEAWILSQYFDFGVVLFDAAWVTLGLMWAPNVSGDLFLLYFLVMFVAAMGESLPVIVASAGVVSVVYAGMQSLQPGSSFGLSATALLRIPFIFVVALFYGYFVTQMRGRRTEAVEARLRERAKTELLSAVSHDLRGPLGNADTLLSLALEAKGDGAPPDRDLLLRAHVNVRRVSSLVTNLLEAACIESGQVRFQMLPVQLNDIVDDVCDLDAGAALLKTVTLEKDTWHGLPMVTADQLQVGRILANLVDNAIKYAAPGGKVAIRTYYDTQNVYLSVEDNGPGMTSDQRASLFAPYRRLHIGRPGTGLGLYIVKRLAEAQGCTVSVKSQVGVGSTFTIAFPRMGCAAGLREPSLDAEEATADPAPQLAIGIHARA